MTEQLVKCPECSSQNYANAKSCYSCKYSFNKKSNNENESYTVNTKSEKRTKSKKSIFEPLAILCYLVGCFSIYQVIYFVIELSDLAKLVPLLGGTTIAKDFTKATLLICCAISAILFFSIGKILTYLQRLTIRRITLCFVNTVE